MKALPGTPDDATAEVIALPAGPGWWRTSMAELQERETRARRRARELSLELDAAGIELRRAEATIAVHARALEESAEREGALRRELEQQAKLAAAHAAQLAQMQDERRALRAERRVLEHRSERLAAWLAAVEASRTYRLVRLGWRVRRALGRPFRALRGRRPAGG